MWESRTSGTREKDVPAMMIGTPPTAGTAATRPAIVTASTAGGSYESWMVEVDDRDRSHSVSEGAGKEDEAVELVLALTTTSWLTWDSRWGADSAHK